MPTTTKNPAAKHKAEPPKNSHPAELVIITGRSGSGKQTVLKAFEDLGFYAVDNLPLALLPKFADLTHDSKTSKRAALIIDVREGEALKDFPRVFRKLRKTINARLIFLDAADEVLQRRFSETRRPHPLGRESPVMLSLREERELMAPIHNLADISIDTSKLNVHELRNLITQQFRGDTEQGKIVIQVNSFGFRNGVPHDSDLVFDVRFLPNPNFIPEFKKLSGRHPSVARYIRSFPQTTEFINRISELLIYLLPHYIREGKSYLTISFGCTGGRHRSVLIASEIRKRLQKAGYTAKEMHRDIERQ
ncbi:MAG TPA: RNase adapter RapZ [Bryobacteraceae bacterium]|nr:RNase adapter RapZ [Bryobacteraceae bacterium]